MGVTNHLLTGMILCKWHYICYRIVLVLVVGGRDFIIPLKAIYTLYISGIYCQLADYMLPTTIYKNLKHRLNIGNWVISPLEMESFHPDL